MNITMHEVSARSLVRWNTTMYVYVNERIDSFAYHFNGKKKN